MIPKYVLERMEEGTSVVYGHELNDPVVPGRDVIFYSGKISKTPEGNNVFVSPTDTRFFSNLTTLDRRTDFVFKLDGDEFSGKPWYRELRTLLRSDLGSEELENRGIVNAVESAINQFWEISRNRSKFYSERAVVEQS